MSSPIYNRTANSGSNYNEEEYFTPEGENRVQNIAPDDVVIEIDIGSPDAANISAPDDVAIEIYIENPDVANVSARNSTHGFPLDRQAVNINVMIDIHMENRIPNLLMEFNGGGNDFLNQVMDDNMATTPASNRPAARSVGVAEIFTVEITHSLSNLSAKANSIAYYRLRKEILKLQKDDPSPYYSAAPREDIFVWDATINGPVNTVYEGGEFKLLMLFDADYPFSPPKMRFLNKIYHCNINASGEVCIDIQHNDEWSGAMTASDILLSLHCLLATCEPEYALDAEIAHQFLTQRDKHDKIAREFTKLYAKPKKEHKMRSCLANCVIQ